MRYGSPDDITGLADRKRMAGIEGLFKQTKDTSPFLRVRQEGSPREADRNVWRTCKKKNLRSGLMPTSNVFVSI